MKKNGFTLIELLAVLIILSIIIMLSFPLVLNAIKRTKSSLDSSVSVILLNSVNTCVNEGNCSQCANLADTATCYVTVKYLIEKNYVTEGMLGNTSDTTILAIKKQNGELAISSTKESSNTVVCQPSEGVVEDGKTTTTYGAGSLPQAKLSDEEQNFVAGMEYKCDPGDGKTRTFYVIKNDQANNLVQLISATNYGGDVPVTAASEAASANAYLNKLKNSWINADEVRMPLPDDIGAATFFRTNLNCPVGSCTENDAALPGNFKYNIIQDGNVVGEEAYKAEGYWTTTASGNYTVITSTGTTTDAGSTATKYGFRPIITIRKIRFSNVANQW